MSVAPVITETTTLTLPTTVHSNDGTVEFFISDLLQMLGDKFIPASSTSPKGIAIYEQSFISTEKYAGNTDIGRWEWLNPSYGSQSEAMWMEPTMITGKHTLFKSDTKMRFRMSNELRMGTAQFSFRIWEPANTRDNDTWVVVSPTGGSTPTTLNSNDVSLNTATLKINIVFEAPQVVNTNTLVRTIPERTVAPAVYDNNLLYNNGILISTILTLLGTNYILGTETRHKGIAISEVDNSTGVWQYSLNNDGNESDFTNIPDILPSSVFLIGDIHGYGSYIRYVPNMYTHGPKSIKIRAWDTQTGENKTIYTYTSLGGYTSLSSETTQLTINVEHVPVISPSISPLALTMRSITEDTRLSKPNLDGDGISDLTNIQYIEGSVSFSGVAICEVDNTNGKWQYKISDGVGNVPWTDIPSVNSTNYLLTKWWGTDIRFIPNYKFNGTSYIKIKAWDGSVGQSTLYTNTTYDITQTTITTAFSTDINTINITINDYPIVAPSLLNSPTMLLSSVNQDIAESSIPTYNIDTIILNTNYVVGTTTAKGIAIYDAPSTSGNWQYRTGITWINFPSVDSINHLLLVSGTSIRFVPNAGFFGTVDFKFRAWDRTDGTDKSVFAVTSTGEDSAFSAGTATGEWRVLSYTPVLTSGLNSQQTGVEDNTININITNFINTLGSDYSIEYTNGKKGILVYDLDTTNSIWWLLNGSTTILTNDQIQTAIANSNAIVIESGYTFQFRPSTNWNGTRTFQFRAWSAPTSLSDPIVPLPTAVGAGTTFSENSGTVTMYIAPMNDAPVITTLTNASLAPYIMPDFYADEGEKIYMITELLDKYTITDVDGDPIGCAIYETATNNIGTWYYSIDNQQSWVAFPAVSLTNTLHLQRNSNTFIKFVPTNNKVFTTTTVGSHYSYTNLYFKFYAWDATNVGSLDSNLIGNATNRGGVNPYSSYPGHLYLSVKSGPPVLSASLNYSNPPYITIDEDKAEYTIIKIGDLLTQIGGNYTKFRSMDQKGIIIYNGNNGLDYTIDGGNTWAPYFQLYIVFNESNNNQIRYKPATNYNGTITLNFNACDMINHTNGEIVSSANYWIRRYSGSTYNASSYSLREVGLSIKVNAINDSPTVAGSYTMTPVNWYPGLATTNTDVPLSTILNASLFQFTDIDIANAQTAQTTTGVAIIGADTTYGSWWYTTNYNIANPSTTVWTQILNISDTNALHLTRDTKNYIRYNGAYLAGLSQLTLRAWDITNGVANGAKADASVYGGTSPYSSATATISRQVNPTVADPPFGLSGTSVENTGISLSWSEPLVKGGAPITGYAIYVAPAGSSFSLHTTVTTTSTILTTLTPGVQYTIQVKAVNSAGESLPTSDLYITYLAKPQLLNTPNVNLISILMNSSGDYGTTVESILTSLGSNYVPVLSNDTKGIAITSLDTTNGYWQYVTEYSGGWQTISATLSSSTPLLLYNSSANAIRFIPNQNFVGSLTGMTFMAWDGKNGVVGEVYTIPEGSMSFSTGTGTFSLSVIGFNTAPNLSGDMNAIDWFPTAQPLSVNTILSNFTLSDNEETATTIGMAVHSINSSIGTWEYTLNNGVNWNTIADPSVTNAFHLTRSENTKIRFVKGSDYANGQVSISFYAWDQTNTSSLTGVIGDTTQTTSAYSVDSKSVTLNVYSFPSAPRNILATPMLNDGYIRIVWEPSEYEGGSTLYRYNVYILQNGSFVKIIRDDSSYPDFNYNSGLQWGQSYTFRIRAENYVGESINTDSVTVQFGSAPQIVNSPTVTLTGIERNVTDYAGYSVDSIIQQLGANYDDSTGSEKAIAITSFSNTNGTWQYWRDGINWTNFPSLTTNQVFLLSTWSSGSIRFIPAKNYQGTETISFRAWNVRWYGFAEKQTYASGSPYFSSDTATVSITVEGGVYINTAPTVTGTIPVQTIYSKLASDPIQPISISSLFTGITVTDVDDSNTQTPPGIAVTAVTATAAGSWQISRNGGSSWTNISGTFPTTAYHFYRLSTEYIRFLPTNGSSTGAATMSFRIWDKSNQNVIDADGSNRGNATSTGGTNPYSTTLLTLTLTVRGGPVAPPSISSSTQTTTSLTLGWGPYTTPNLNGGTLTGYNIYSVIGSGASAVYTLIGTTDASTRTYTITSNLTNKTDLNFAVTGTTNYGEGAYGTITVHFVGVLPATTQPQLNNTPVLLFPSIQMNVTNPSGISIAEIITLLGSNYVKGSPTDEDGISISSRGASGTWQYSTNNGTTWTPMPALSASSQLLLTAVPTDSLTNRVRFIPSTNFTGTSSITLRAWNPLAGVTGLPGTTFTRASYFGYSTFFSTDTATASFPIITAPTASQVNLNNTPTITIPSILEDATTPAGTSIASLITLLGSNYAKGSVSDETGVGINSVQNANGSWQYSLNNGSTWIAIPSVNSTTHFLLSATPTGGTTQLIRFIPSANYNGNALISFRAWNPVSGGAGTAGQTFTYAASVYFSTGTASAAITVTGVNDAPTMTGSYTFLPLNATATSELTPVSIESIVSSFTLTDVDDINAQSVTSLAIIGADQICGTWYYSRDNQSTWTALTNITASTAVHFNRDGTEYLKFTPVSSGTTNIQIRAWDKTNTGSLTNMIGNASSGGGTTAYSANTITLNCVVTSKPSPPRTITTQISSQGIPLYWNSPLDSGGLEITGYNIYDQTSGASVFLKSVIGTTTILTSEFIAGTTYTFTITAINSIGESNPESINITYITNPEPPTNITADGSNTQVSLTWTAPISNGGAAITGYGIYNGDTLEILKTIGNSTETTIENLINYPIYFFKIKTINAANLESEYSSASLAMPTGIVDVNTHQLIKESMATVLQNNSTPVNTTAAVINSISFTNMTNDKEILLSIVKSSLESIVNTQTLTQHIPTVISTTASVFGAVTSTIKKRKALESVNKIIVREAIGATSSSETRSASLATIILNTITEISNSDMVSYKEESINTVATTLLENTDLPTTTAVATAIVMGTANPTLKTNIFGNLATVKASHSILLSGSDLNAIKDSVTVSNRTAEFTNLTNLCVCIPSIENVINMTNEPTDRGLFLAIKPDTDYTITYNGVSKIIKYNSSDNLIYSESNPILLGGQIVIGGSSFKVIQKGTGTLLYNGTVPVHCIVKGQKILTPNGEVAVETLKDGDFILTPDNRIVPVRIYTHIVDKSNNITTPVEISAGAFGPNMPPRNLQVSPLHAVYKGNNLWEIPYSAMNRYKGVKQLPLRQKVIYYHIETPNYITDHLVVEGCVIESFGKNYVKQHGLQNIGMYSWTPHKNGFVRYKPSQQTSMTK